MSSINIANAEARVAELLEYLAKLPPAEYPYSIRAFCRQFEIDLGSFRTADVWRPLFLEVRAKSKWLNRAADKEAMPDVITRKERSLQLAEQRRAKVRKALAEYREAGELPKSRAELMRRAGLRDQLLDHPLLAEVKAEVRAAVAEWRNSRGMKGAQVSSEAEYEKLRQQNEAAYAQALAKYRTQRRRRALG